MIKILFAVIVIAHALIHLIGFAKGMGWGESLPLTKTISLPMGLVWLATTLCLLLSIVLLLTGQHSWIYLATIGALASQALIITQWHDARFGTIINVAVLLAVALKAGSLMFEQTFRKDVEEAIASQSALITPPLKSDDIAGLPLPVQQYIRHTGCVGKPIVNNMRAVFEGKMRDKGKDWFSFTSVQYNFFDEPTRLFFMKARMFGITVPGYHAYKHGQATMNIKLFGLVPIVSIKGKELDIAETVTVFNDMCLLAPASLTDKRIKWQAIDSTSAKAIFTNRGISITATLYFDSKGRLVNFVSNNRYAVADMKQYPFSTPVSPATNHNGYQITGGGDAIWHYPDGDFTYGKFNLKSIDYNVPAMQ